MAEEKTLDWLINNINEDIEKASRREIDSIYDELKKILKKYDNDPILKDIYDLLKKLFKSKKEKCRLVFKDIIEEIVKPEFSKKEELRKDLLDISNIHRDLLENIISLLESL